MFNNHYYIMKSTQNNKRQIRKINNNIKENFLQEN